MNMKRRRSRQSLGKGRTVGRPFVPGYDRRRHILTREERQRGGLTSSRRGLRTWAQEQLGHSQGFR